MHKILLLMINLLNAENQSRLHSALADENENIHIFKSRIQSRFLNSALKVTFFNGTVE